MNGWLVMAYVIVHLVGSMQRVLIEYVGTGLVCDGRIPPLQERTALQTQTCEVFMNRRREICFMTLM